MQRGEIIALGKHRLMCGDATSKEDVYALIGDDKVNMVLTDPPYGINIFQPHGGTIGGGNKNAQLRQNVCLAARKHLAFADDTTESAKKHYEIVKGIKKLIIWGGNYFTDFLPVSGGWLFWDKNRRGLDFSDGELAYRSWGKKVSYYKQTWNGVCMEGNYKLNTRIKTARIHPTQKPVELHMKILEDFSSPGDIILDCFGGSGTTLIACEMTGRKCLMMEISPEYCEIIIQRYESLAGIFAQKEPLCRQDTQN